MSFKYFQTSGSVNDRIRSFTAIFSICLSLLLGACSKKEVNPPNPASLLVFNGISNGPALYKVFSHQRPVQFRNPDSIKNNTFSLIAGSFVIPSSPQDIMFFTTTDTLAKDGPILKTSLELEKGAMYSMFLYGTPVAPAYLLQKDEVPPIGINDSLTLIRFANFSSEQAFSVNLKGKPAGSLFQQVAQHSVSGFISLPLFISITNYELEIRDLVSGDLLITHQINNVFNEASNIWFRRPYTLILTGQRTGTGNTALKVINMNHR